MMESLRKIQIKLIAKATAKKTSTIHFSLIFVQILSDFVTLFCAHYNFTATTFPLKLFVKYRPSFSEITVDSQFGNVPQVFYFCHFLKFAFAKIAFVVM